MKIFTLTIILLFLSFPVDTDAKKKNKEYPRAEIKVSYDYPHKHLKTDAKAYDTEHKMLLLVNSGYSKFFSPRTEFLDSLKSTPSGEAIYNKMMSVGVKKAIETGDHSYVPTSQGSLYVFKNRGDSIVTVYDKAGMFDKGYYSEPLAEMV